MYCLLELGINYIYMGSILTFGDVNSSNHRFDLSIEEQGVKKLEYGSARVVSKNYFTQPGICEQVALAVCVPVIRCFAYSSILYLGDQFVLPKT